MGAGSLLWVTKTHGLLPTLAYMQTCTSYLNRVLLLDSDFKASYINLGVFFFGIGF